MEINNFEINNDYCIMYNERFALTVEAFLFKKIRHVNSLYVIGYGISQVDLGQFE